jgi:hypothetical protein
MAVARPWTSICCPAGHPADRRVPGVAADRRLRRVRHPGGEHARGKQSPGTSRVAARGPAGNSCRACRAQRDQVRATHGRLDPLASQPAGREALMMRIAVLGGGVMGEALIVGMQRRLDPSPQIVVAEKRPERSADLVRRLGIQEADPAGAVAGLRRGDPGWSSPRTSAPCSPRSAGRYPTAHWSSPLPQASPRP